MTAIGLYGEEFIDDGPRNMLVKIWLLAMSTVTMVVVGSRFNGPAMNPANAFGWAYVNNKHNTRDQFYVFWICPLTGAILAGFAPSMVVVFIGSTIGSCSGGCDTIGW